MYEENQEKKSISIQNLLNKPLIHSRDFRENGYPSSLLSYYQNQGLIQKVERGLYCNVKKIPRIDFKWEDLVYTVLSVPNGVITGISALDIYDLTDEIPRFYWIAIPNNTSMKITIAVN